MEFSPANNIVRLCLLGMEKAGRDRHDEAKEYFDQAWEEASNDFEKFIAAGITGNHKSDCRDRIYWFETALNHAWNANDNILKSAFYYLYSNISYCYEKLRDPEKARLNSEFALSYKERIFDEGPFYHGTRADLMVGDELTAGKQSNYKESLTMNHIYFTADANGAGLAAALARGDGKERVYVVEPSGEFENDPNVTDKKFPGNLTRSYRTTHPLKIVGEIANWKKQSPEDIKRWREKLDNNKGEIIN